MSSLRKKIIIKEELILVDRITVKEDYIVCVLTRALKKPMSMKHAHKLLQSCPLKTMKN